MDERSGFSRGQVFGFTMAEIFLLILFCLLLILTHQIFRDEEKIEVYEFERAKLERVLLSLNQDKDSLYLVLKSFHEQIRHEEERLKDDMLRYDDLRRVMLSLGPDYAAASSDTERMKILREKLVLANAFYESGIPPNVTKDELRGMYEVTKNPQKMALMESAKAQASIKSLEGKVKQCEKEGAFARKELEACTKTQGKGVDLPPCWISSEGDPVYLYSVTLYDNSFKVRKLYRDKDLGESRYPDVIRSIPEGVFDRELPVETFKETFSKLTAAGLSDKGDQCRFWVNVCDRVSESKSTYKRRRSDVWGLFTSRLSACRD